MKTLLMGTEGESILRNEARELERILSGTIWQELDGWNVPTVNTPVLASESCEALLEAQPGGALRGRLAPDPQGAQVEPAEPDGSPGGRQRVSPPAGGRWARPRCRVS